MRDNTSFNRRDYLKTAGALGLAGAFGLAGCSGTSDSTANAATGTLATVVKDAPGDIDDFESVVVTIDGIWVKSADGTDDESETDETADAPEKSDQPMDPGTDVGRNGTESSMDEPSDDEDTGQGNGRTYYGFDESQEADLVQLQDGNTKLIGEQEVPVGSYRFLQLDVSNVEGTLVSGDSAEVDTPGNAPLQFKHAFEVRAGQRTVFTADFTPVKRGQTNRYLFQPVAKGTTVSYDDEAEPTDEETSTDAEPTTDQATTTARGTTADSETGTTDIQQG